MNILCIKIDVQVCKLYKQRFEVRLAYLYNNSSKQMYNYYEEQLIFDCLDLPKENCSEDNVQVKRCIAQNSIYFQTEKNQANAQYQHQKAEVQKLIPTGLSNQDLQQKDFPPQSQILIKQIQYQKTNFLRDISYVQTSENTIHNRQFTIKGNSYQTQNIGKHLKSITVNFLLMLYQARFLDCDWKQAIDCFNVSNGAIKDFQQLFLTGQLRKICLDFYSSKNYIVWVMNSCKMDFYSKLMMMKYAEKLRSLTYTDVKGWKLQ